MCPNSVYQLSCTCLSDAAVSQAQPLLSYDEHFGTNISRSESQSQHASDTKPPKTSFFDSDKLMIAGGSFSQVVTTNYNTSVGTFPGLDMLRSAISISAMHDARDRFLAPKCFPDTYTNIKETVLQWSTKHNQPALLCFTGESKSGKSAIAHGIAEILSSQGTLAGSFFFEGDKNQDDGDFFLTLAYQIAVNIPGMDHLINTAVLRDPTVLRKRGEIQLTKLIQEPLFCLPTPTTPFTVVVDDFDRCKSVDVQMEIIWLISRASLVFRNTLRFIIFADRDRLDAVLGWNNYYYWVGRHIPLGNFTPPSSPFSLSCLTDQFLNPLPSSVDSISEMWLLPPSLITLNARDTASSFSTTGTNAVYHEIVRPHSSGSLMSVDLLRQSPREMSGSPMLIDSLRLSPAYQGSPMLVDSLDLSQQYADIDPGGISSVWDELRDWECWTRMMPEAEGDFNWGLSTEY